VYFIRVSFLEKNEEKELLLCDDPDVAPILPPSEYLERKRFVITYLLSNLKKSGQNLALYMSQQFTSTLLQFILLHSSL
jgi:hypothetical protein